MRNAAILSLTALVTFGPLTASEIATPLPGNARPGATHVEPAAVLPPTGGTDAALSAAQLVHDHAWARLQGDLTVMQVFRPGYPFWQHIFTIPDGSIAYGSAVDGRLIAVFPAASDWVRSGDWQDPALAARLAGRRLPARLGDRRDVVAALLEPAVGPVLHNPTRGRFLLPNARRYGSFLSEWGAIYERFGVPAEIGLSQVIIESGLNGTIRSPARAVGFCQWLQGNWRRLQQLAPNVIEGHNQTTQAPYCAAYLTVLATKYGTFIPALSEHHAGGTNVGRTVINGSRLGGADVREQYLLGAEFARDVRAISIRDYRDLFRTYGPRSFRYSEMVFGNTANVRHLTSTTPQTRIYAMRARRAIPLAEITRRTGLSVDEVRRFNPALIRQVPARANLYLPSYIEDFGPNVSFWHEPPSAAYASILNEFIRLDPAAERWDDASFAPVLRDFRRRFDETRTEEGAVMSTVLAYVLDEMTRSRRAEILADFRTNVHVRRLFERAVIERETARGAGAQ